MRPVVKLLRTIKPAGSASCSAKRKAGRAQKNHKKRNREVPCLGHTCSLTYLRSEMSATLPFTDLLLHPLQEADYAFMLQHRNGNIPDLLLSSGFTARQKLLLQQVGLRQKAEKKLPDFCAHEGYLFPSTLSVEQSSSESAARFKGNLFAGERFIDLTAGMGCDAYFLGQSFRAGILVERQTALAEITRYNVQDVLGSRHLQVEQGVDASDFLMNLQGQVDLIFLDPARRDLTGGKVFKLSDGEPDVCHLLPALWAHTDVVVVKTSPLLDIDLACRQLGSVGDVYVLSAGNECRELLFVLKKNQREATRLHAVNLDKGTDLQATRLEEQKAHAVYGPPSIFLYEPDVSLLKAGLFKTVATTFGLHKLHAHSHLYTSEHLRSDFPGRVFALQHVLKPDKKELKAVLPAMQANLSIRNFPGSVAALRKTWGLREGGEDYVFATTLVAGEKVLLHVRKVNANLLNQ